MSTTRITSTHLESVKESNSPTNILVLSLSGIGNYLMHTPAITALARAYPNATLTVWVAPRGTKPLALLTPGVDHVIERPIKRSLFGHLWQMWRLSRRQFDLAVMLSPGQLWKGAVYMTAAGIERRVAHRYPHLGNESSNFLLTDSIIENPDQHDIEQNLELLRLLGISSQRPASYTLTPPPRAREKAERLLQRSGAASENPLIALHPGSAPGFEWKRWPAEHFTQLAQTIISRTKAHILLIGTPHEQSLRDEIATGLPKQHVSHITTDLLTTAAVLARTHAMVSNDSGMMHLAASVGTPTWGLFGPTDEQQTGPRGRNSHVIRMPSSTPVYHTELSTDLGNTPHQTLTDLTPAFVWEQLARHAPFSRR